ncbi:MAG: 3-deoxy-D-manno-octulosonate 8-phosphate phosphatase [Clostridium sp.]|nr:3-deoxy-D-manno-octulosonate 8-phosphate phosphatase [Ruminococcus flavefaciens]MCM1500674.1 3-deoxy-D-manno-octulosonate 8-phosphate phosphatase [Clostridium sp.]
MRKENSKKIKYLVMDVDGTLTNGIIYIGIEGEVFKSFNVKDGYGISKLLPAAGIVPIIITGRTSKITEARCKELGIKKLYQGVVDKCEKLKEILSEEKINQVAYIGDDISDIECMIYVKAAGGIVGCPADAVAEVQSAADFISEKKGGEGAVRDFIENII